MAQYTSFLPVIDMAHLFPFSYRQNAFHFSFFQILTITHSIVFHSAVLLISNLYLLLINILLKSILSIKNIFEDNKTNQLQLDILSSGILVLPNYQPLLARSQQKVHQNTKVSINHNHYTISKSNIQYCKVLASTKEQCLKPPRF